MDVLMKNLIPPQFIKSTRNPFNRNQKYSISIFKFNHKNVKIVLNKK